MGALLSFHNYAKTDLKTEVKCFSFPEKKYEAGKKNARNSRYLLKFTSLLDAIFF